MRLICRLSHAIGPIQLMHALQSGSGSSRSDAEAFLAGQQELIFDTDGSWFQWALERNEDGVVLGDIAVHFLDQGRRSSWA